MAGKQRFGRVRKLPSGRFQARYPGPDGYDRPAPSTFATKRDAEQGLVLKEAEITRGSGSTRTRAKCRSTSTPKSGSMIACSRLGRAHLDGFAEDGPDGRVFAGPRGGPLRRSGFRRIWNEMCADVGLPGLHFHDLRHVGNTLSATTGASLKELMARMGRASTRAALIYQHASQKRDQVVAAARNGHGSANGLESRTARVGGSCLWPGPSWWERATGIEPA
ncbi:tyrosine-type recombinase/integrase [Actinomadura rubrisoli]|uniref:tyrosine-type recombinase/integrase n=1 Tax=Actinomadura rubrisoli TaxID=2530368 RepID=UPI001A9DBAC1